MYKNYFIIALRNFLKDKTYALINLIGLAVGLASVILIFAYVKYELSYDKSYSNSNRVYRLTSENNNDEKTVMLPKPLALTLETEFPEIEATAVMAILIACSGLFSLVALSVQQRTKEIGIRKVLGASITDITALLSKDFVKLVCIAILIASPIAWLLMNKWLDDFAYRIKINSSIFIFSTVLVIAITIATVLFQAIKAEMANPVKSLRTE